MLSIYGTILRPRLAILGFAESWHSGQGEQHVILFKAGNPRTNGGFDFALGSHRAHPTKSDKPHYSPRRLGLAESGISCF